ncbi:hypothetical protein JOF56_010772 [Kibdelosporangium banguiense]|uniref:Uncharacterized protein n=1 Tax=Kibdelosporangium banguiense TaxID=1365924 RepID=A0ABS4U158_9PSEU|nr:hypothetical protein [Kibdelosporangium banguiense]MBP2330387.1 hypothetical protein [Kibdelosporangium banguiense]
MDIRHVVTFETPIGSDVRSLLTAEGAQPDLDPLSWLAPSIEAFVTIEAKLNERGIPFDVYFEFQPGPGDDPQNLAAYVGLDDFAEVNATAEDLVLACDERTLATVASRRMRQLLDAITSGVTFDPLTGYEGFFVITNAIQLPDPIIVPRTMFLSEGTTGTWAVQSDGRELLTERNFQIVRESGMVHAPYCTANNRVLPWHRPPIFGGPLLTRFRDMDIQGIIDPPAFLGPVTEQEIYG